MICSVCNGTMIRLCKSIPFESKALGTILVPDVTLYKCKVCEDSLYDVKTSQKIIDFVRRAEQTAISELPLKDFVSAIRAAEILGISKQAFSKNEKIKRGFIYSATLDNKHYYYKKSVETFKKSGDGRLLLSLCFPVESVSENALKSWMKNVSTSQVPKTRDMQWLIAESFLPEFDDDSLIFGNSYISERYTKVVCASRRG